MPNFKKNMLAQRKGTPFKKHAILETFQLLQATD
jgi:hypothetical protein